MVFHHFHSFSIYFHAIFLLFPMLFHDLPPFSRLLRLGLEDHAEDEEQH